MTGEIAAAYVAILPSFRSFGSNLSAQMGPQVVAAARAGSVAATREIAAIVGNSQVQSAARATGVLAAAGASGAKETAGWFGEAAEMAFKNVALYGSMYGAIQLIRSGTSGLLDDMVGFNVQLQNAEIGFATILGSQQASQAELSWIKDFAKATPFNYGDVVKYDQQLTAMIGDSKEAHDALQAAGDAAAGLGRGVEGIQSISLALGQMATKGKIQSQELVLQLSQVGINGVKILADSLGATTQDIQDRMEKGLLDSATYLPVLIAGIEQQYAGLMQKQSATLGGMWSNIQDTLQQDLAEAGKPLFDELTAEAKAALEGLSDPQVQESLNQVGDVLASAAKGVGEFAREAVGFFGQLAPMVGTVLRNGQAALPVILGLTAAFVAARKVQQGGLGVGFFATMAAEAKAASAAVTSVVRPTQAMAAAQKVAVAASVQLGAAQFAEAKAASAATAAAELATQATTRGTEASKASWAAQRSLTEATQARMVANADLVSSEAAVTAATERALASQKRIAAVQAGFSKFSGVGQALGFTAAISGVTALGDAEADAGQQALGFAGAIGGGALAGAAFGATLTAAGGPAVAIGAVAGALIGGTAALIQWQAAVSAAEHDGSKLAEALQAIGVASDTATSAIGSINLSGFADIGGSVSDLQHALETGTVAEYVAQMEAAAAGAKDYEKSTSALTKATDGQGAAMQAAVDAAQYLEDNYVFLKAAQDQVLQSQLAGAEASDLQTGSYGRQSEAAFEVARANGVLTSAFLTTTAAAEGLGGTAGYVISMLTGIPVNTPINFSTNAKEILAQVAALVVARDAVSGDDVSAAKRTVSLTSQINALEASLKSALQTPLSIVGLPDDTSSSGGSGSTYDAAAAAAEQAAAAAAAKLKADQSAQLAFGDAFGTLMENALAGNFDEYRDKLTSEIKSLTRDGYQAAADTLKRLSGNLDQVALDYSALTNKIKAASSAEDDLTKKMQEQYQSSVDLIMGLGKVSDAQSFDQLTYLLGQTTSAANQYQDVLKSLKDEGLSDELWNQLANAGPESLGLAQSILAQGQAGVDQLNSLSSGLVSAADSMGSLVSQSMYQQGVDAMQAYIDGLSSQESALEAQLVTIGNNILNQTAGAITPGNQGYAAIVGGTTTTSNTYSITIDASDLDDIKSIQDFIAKLEAAPTTQLQNAAGTVTS